MFRKITAAIALATCAAGYADVTVIEGFENTDDPGNWQLNMTATHTHNILPNGFSVPEYVTSNVTEGSLAGRFHTYWSSGQTTSTANPYEPAGPLVYWAARFNVNAQSNLPNNLFSSDSTTLEADIANEMEYPVQVSLAVVQQGDANLERGPLVTIEGNSTGTYSWDMATVPPVAFTGDGVLTGDAQLKSLLVYTEDQPTTNQLSLIVDNIRAVTDNDITAPAVPTPLAFEQGTGAGVAILRWEPVSEADLAEYRIYTSTDAQFGSPTPNRMTIRGEDVVTSVPAGQSSVVLTGLPTGQVVYATVTAVDNAPDPNESGKGLLMAVKLEPNGDQPLDRIVLDLDEYQPGDPGFLDNSYMPAVAYTAQALDGLGRTFDSVTAAAIEANVSMLTVNGSGVVVWSNMLDGTSIAGGSISATNLAAIQNFYLGGGNIIVSGTNTAADVDATHDNLETTLRASLVSGDVFLSEINPVGPLGALPSFTTSLSTALHTVAYATTANDAIQVAGSHRLALYDGIDQANGAAAIGYDASLVFLGFAFESVGDPAAPSNSAALRQQLMGGMIEYLVGETAANDWQLFN